MAKQKSHRIAEFNHLRDALSRRRAHRIVHASVNQLPAIQNVGQMLVVFSFRRFGRRAPCQRSRRGDSTSIMCASVLRAEPKLPPTC
jgi:hypothetical protein